MPPKPRQTIKALKPISHADSSSTSSDLGTARATSVVKRGVRRKRWIYSPASLVLLLVLQPVCLMLCFVLLTEPCLNPQYVNTLSSKLNYITLLTTRDAIAEIEWKTRFWNAGLRSLFGIGVIQAWFTARLNSYVQKADREHTRIVNALKFQREKGIKNVGLDTRMEHDQVVSGENGEKEGVGSFVRQLESVGLTFLGLPFVWIGVFGLMVLFGAPIRGGGGGGTGIVAAYLTFLIGLPLVHILGLPLDTPPTTTTSSSSSSSSSTTTTTTILPNSTKYWSTLLMLKPNPSFLLPLYYPPILTSMTTLLCSTILALDWGKSYQTYPFPLLVGALVGNCLANFYIVIIVLFG
ncbi:uncharacterized protein MEPE_02273 [Melanopsichium pennsylvanicum]|uniref:Uncharacterized protein n=1 Tax=Melanopsichium pennsylvanicum TaxID=63383 RepID=A0AAJ5C4C9_9BASI|nr:uncharacterized protein MEPE_02273 [Melanopsichium pennsylvanicum]